MQRRTNIQVTSLIILLSIITILVQFVIYYFFSAFYIILGAAVLINALCCHLIIEQTATYEACFSYSVLNLFISTIIIVLSYFGKDLSLLPYTSLMLGIAIINWLIPSVHCFTRNMLDYGTRLEDYSAFYRKDSVLFFAVYLIFLLYTAFSKASFSFTSVGSLDTVNFIPFEAITIQIEDFLYDIVPLKNILTYLLSRILLFLPYGFQLALLLRRQGRLVRFASLLVLPLSVELVQYFLFPSRCDIDDIIYGLIGGIVGTLLFYLCNMLYRAFAGKDFLAGRGDAAYSRGKLRF
jgi:glycopeptide antibiotics resistance protein